MSSTESPEFGNHTKLLIKTEIENNGEVSILLGTGNNLFCQIYVLLNVRGIKVSDITLLSFIGISFEDL